MKVAKIRRRAVPTRPIGDKVVVARPSDGAPVVLAPTATIVWEVLADWTSPDTVDLRLAEVYPGVPDHDRDAARAQILIALMDDDLLETS